MPNETTTPGSYTIILCGDCSFGPPCRCSDDPATVEVIWNNGRREFVATCTPSPDEAR